MKSETAGAFGAFLAKELERLAPVVKAAGSWGGVTPSNVVPAKAGPASELMCLRPSQNNHLRCSWVPAFARDDDRLRANYSCPSITLQSSRNPRPPWWPRESR